jgi:CO/xanthine dehydrogenase FAD-binding subunit
MFTCKEYKRAETLEEAWQLNQKKSSLLIGGMLWLKMGQRNAQTVIDLSGLGLDQIEENEEEFRIGCMATLRQMETHEGLNRYTGGAIRESVRHIVGVQFRNVATVGGSVFGRFGFSDVLTMLLAMDSYVELYKGGILPMSEFVELKRDRDILVHVIIRKTDGVFAYQSMRHAKTDFPTLAVAASCMEGKLRISVGARPARAMLLEIADEVLAGSDAAEAEQKRAGSDASVEQNRTDSNASADAQNVACIHVEAITEKQAQQIGVYAAEHIPTGSNLRGSAEYRSELVKVLVKRAVLGLKVAGAKNAENAIDIRGTVEKEETPEIKKNQEKAPEKTTENVEKNHGKEEPGC